MKIYQRTLALFLCFVMCFSLLPTWAFAEGEEKPEHEHDYKTVVTKPTCTEKGYTTYTCECGDSYVDDYTDPLNHPETTVLPGYAPGCTSSGLTDGLKCAVCGETLKPQEEIPATGHTAEYYEEVPATETSTGLTAGSKCAVCGEKLEGFDEIPMLEPAPEPEPLPANEQPDHGEPAAETPAADPAAEEETKPVEVSFEFNVEDVELRVYIRDDYSNETNIEAEEDGSYLLIPGRYYYTVHAEGYADVEETELLVEASEDLLTVPVELDGAVSDEPGEQEPAGKEPADEPTEDQEPGENPEPVEETEGEQEHAAEPTEGQEPSENPEPVGETDEGQGNERKIDNGPEQVSTPAMNDSAEGNGETLRTDSSFEDPTPIASGETSTATIENEGEFFYFTFTPTETGYYGLESYSVNNESEYTNIDVIDEDNNFVSLKENSSYWDEDRLIYRAVAQLLAEKTYYFRVYFNYGNTGEIKVHLFQQNEYVYLNPVSDTSIRIPYGEEASLEVQLDASDDSNLALRWTKYVYINGVWDNPTDLDETGNVLTIQSVKEVAQYQCTAYDTTDLEPKAYAYFSVYIEQDFSAEAVQSVFNPDIGDSVTLQVRVTGNDADKVSYSWSRGNSDTDTLTLEDLQYGGRVTCTVSDPFGNAENVYFDININAQAEQNGFDDAVNLTLGVPGTVTAMNANDRLYFRFTTEEEGDYQLFSSNNTSCNYHLSLNNSDQSYYSDYWPDRGVSVNLPGSTTFYIIIDSFSDAGPFTLTVRKDPHLEIHRWEDWLYLEVGQELDTGEVWTAEDPDAITCYWTKLPYGETEEVLLEGETGNSLVVSVPERATYICHVSDGIQSHIIHFYVQEIYNGLYIYALDNEMPILQEGETLILEVQAEAVDPSQLRYVWTRMEEDGSQSEPIGDSTTLEVSEIGVYICTVYDQYGNDYSVQFRVRQDNAFYVWAEQAELAGAGGETVKLKVMIEARDKSGITKKWYRVNNYGNNSLLSEPGDELTVEVTANASYYCEVSDQYGNEDTVWFNVYKLQELGLASTITLPPSKTYFVFTPEVTGTYVLGCDSWNAASMILYDSSWNQITNNNGEDWGDYSPNLSRRLTAGETYYYKVDVYDLELSFSFRFDNKFSASAEQSSFYISGDETVILKAHVDAKDASKVTYTWTNVTSGEILSSTGATLETDPLGEAEENVYSCLVEDGYGNAATLSFYIRLIDDSVSGVTFETATDIEVGGTYTAQIDREGDSAYFRFIPEEDGNYIFYQHCSDQGVYVKVYNALKQQMRVEQETTLRTTVTLAADETYYFVTGFTSPNETDSIPVSLGKENNLYVDAVGATNYSVHPGDGVTLEVYATADDDSSLSYSWEDEQNNPLGTTEKYVISSVQSAQDYRCTVSDGYGNSETVRFAVRIENNFNAMAAEDSPESVFLTYGGTATFHVTATARDLTRLSYTWEKEITDEEYEDTTWVSVQTGTDSYTTELYSGSEKEYYRCVVEDGWSGASVEVHFTVYPLAEGMNVSFETAYQLTQSNNSWQNESNYDGVDYVYFKVIPWFNGEYAFESSDEYGDPLEVHLYKELNSIQREEIADNFDYEGYYGYGEYTSPFRYRLNAGEIYYYAVRQRYEMGVSIHFTNSLRAEGSIKVNPDETVTLKVLASADDKTGLSFHWTDSQGKDLTTEATGAEITVEATGAEITVGPITESSRFFCEVTDGYGNSISVPFTVGIPGAHSSIETADDITIDLSKPVEIANPGEYVYFRFLPEKTCSYAFFCIEGSPDTYGYILDEYGNILASDDDSGGDSNFRVTCILEAEKIYYLAARLYSRNDTGNFHVRIQEDDELRVQPAGSTEFNLFPGAKAILRVSVTAPDMDAVSIEWLERSGNNLNLIPDESGTTLTLNDVTRSAEYVCRATDDRTTAETSFTVNVDSRLRVEPEQETVFVEKNGSCTLRVVTSVLGGKPLSYIWYDEDENEIESATGEELELTSVTRDADYTCEVHDAYGNSVTVSVSVRILKNSLPLSFETAKRIREGDIPLYDANDYRNTTVYFRFCPETSGEYAFILPETGSAVITLYDASQQPIAETQGTQTMRYDLEEEQVYYYSVLSTDFFSRIILRQGNHFSATADQDTVIVQTGNTATLTVTVQADDRTDLSFAWIKRGNAQNDGMGQTLPITTDELNTEPVTEREEYICTVEDRFGNTATVYFTVYARAANYCMEEAEEIGLDGTTLAVIGVPGDMAWYTFQPTVSGWYAFSSENHIWNTYNPAYGMYGTLYNADGVRLISNYSGNNDGNFRLTCELAEGETYYFSAGFRAEKQIGSIPVTLKGDNHLTVQAVTATTLLAEPNAPVTMQVQASAVEADGITYQWYQRYQNQEGYYYQESERLLNNETGYSLTLPSVTGKGDYYCKVTDKYGNTAKAYFTVQIDNRLRVLPQGTKTIQGVFNEDVTMQVTATALDMTGIRYDWSQNGYAIPEAGPELTVPVTGRETYSCKVSDRYGNSMIVYFNILVDNQLKAWVKGTDNETKQTITLQPGGSTKLKIAYSATETNGITIIWVQNGERLDQNSDTLKLTNIQTTKSYICSVSDVYGNTATVNFTVMIENHLTASTEGQTEDGWRYITVSPNSVSPNNPLTLTVTADSDDHEVYYRWYDYRTGTELTNERTGRLEISSITQMSMYQCVVTDRFGNTVTITFQINIENHFRAFDAATGAVGTENSPIEKVIEEGKSETLTVSTSADDQTGITYHWAYRRVEGEGIYYSYINGETAPSYTTPPATIEPLELGCIVTDRYGSNRIVCYTVRGEHRTHTAETPTRENEVAPTCETAGSYDEVVYCRICHEEMSRNTITLSALGHLWDNGTVTTEPTCTETGVRTYICQHDNSHRRTEEISALGHDWGEYAVTKEPTCTETGLKTRICKHDSSHKETEEIPATGHTPVVDTAVDPTCEETGLTEGSHCSVCGEILVAQEVIPALDHDWDDGIVTLEPTCTEAGIKLHTCRHDASHTYTEDVPPKGHTWGDPIHEKESEKCNEPGSYEEVVYCKVCRAEQYRKTVETEAVPHKYTILSWSWEGDHASLEYECSRCGHSGEKTEDEVTVETEITDATYTSIGKIVYTASVELDDGITHTKKRIKSIPMLVLGVPASITTKTANNAVTVSWAAVTDADGYELERKAGSDDWTVLDNTLTETVYTDSALQNGTVYTYRVRAVRTDGARPGGYTESGELTFVIIPTAKVAAVSKTVKVSWNKVGAAKYKVERKEGSGSFKTLATITGTSYTDKTVKNNKVYQYRVTPLNAAGKALNSASAAVKITFLTPTAISSLTATKGKNVVKWNKITGAVKYEVWRMEGSGAWKKVTTVKTVSYTDKKVKAKKKYTYKIVAVAKDGSLSAASATKAITAK